jgi:branched-subunit amino acid ABC-type transport system permease component
MSIDSLLAGFVDGLLIGFVYGVAAMGLTIIFGVMDVINLAHGPLIAIGMFGVYELFTHLGMNPYLAIVLVAMGGLLIGVIVYFTAVHRVIDAPPLSSLLSTFSVNMMIIGVGTAILSTSAFNVNYSLPALSAGPITVTGNRVAAGLVAILVTALLYAFLYRTRPGKYIRAVANNRQAAELMGIPSTRILALAFGIGTMLAMTAGGLIATILPINILAGGTYELKSFVIVVLGGLGNPLGALIGGLILGLIEGLVPIFLKVTWVPVIEFSLFVLILLVMPQGLFGKKGS